MESIFPHILPDIKQWPISKVSERRTEFIAELNQFTKAKLYETSPLSKEELLEKTIYLEKLRVRNNPWKVDPADDKIYWKELENEVKLAKTSINEDEQLDAIIGRIINRYNQEIVGKFKINTFLFSRKFLTSLFKKLYNPFMFKGQKGLWGNRKQVQEKIKLYGAVDEMRNLFTKGTMVILPTHFSNLDSILIGYGIDAVAGLPAFSYGAGLNLLDNEIVAYYINRLGAYRVDRRKKNPLYLECLKSMANYSLQQGLNQIFFPGGTRSRDGRLEDKLKLGLLGSLVEAQRQAIGQEGGKKIIIVPMVLGYHFVLEGKSLVDQHLRTIGQEKYTRSVEGSSSNGIFNFIKSVFSKESEVMLSIGKPIDVFGNEIDADGRSIDKHGKVIDINGYFELEGELKTVAQREKVYTKLLGDKIADSFLVNNVVMSSHLVAFIAFRYLMKLNPELNLYDTLNIPVSTFEIDRDKFLSLIDSMKTVLLSMEVDGKLKLSEIMSKDSDEILTDGMKNLGLYHPQKVLKYNKLGNIISENFRLLYYYHNRLDSYHLEDMIEWKVDSNVQRLEETIR